MRQGPRQVGWLRRAAARAAGWMLRAALGQTTLREFLEDFAAFSGERERPLASPMAQSTHVLRAVTTIATTLAAGQPVLTRRGAGEPLTGGPAYDLVHTPDGDMTWPDFVQEWAGQLMITGAAFVLDADAVESGMRSVPPRPARLTVYGQNRMLPEYVPGSNPLRLRWWNLIYGGAPIPVLPELAPYTRLFNPDNPWLGLAPLQAALLDIQCDYKAALFNAAALDNGGAVGGLYILPDDPGEEQRREYLRAIEARHGGAARARRPGLLWGGADYKETAMSMVDLQMLDLRKLSREAIYEAFGVPPVLGAIFDSAHYQIGDAAQDVFLENVIKPLAVQLAALFNRFILPAVEPGVTLALDFSSHPLVQRQQQGKIDKFVALVEHFVPPNRAAQFLGLPLGDLPHGEHSFATGTLATVEDIVAGAGAAADENAPAEPDEDQPQAGPPQAGPPEAAAALRPCQEGEVHQAAGRDQARFERQQVRLAMLRVKPKIGAFLARQTASVLRIVEPYARPDAADAGACRPPGGACGDESGDARHVAATEDEIRRVLARVALEIGRTHGALRKLVGDALRANLKTALAAELRRLGLAPDKIAKAVEAALHGKFLRAIIRTKEIKVVGVNATTVARLRRTLSDGLRQSETIQELADRVRASIEGANRSRALTIARTEAGQAVSTARFAAAAAAGATAKAWLTGANPRGTHIAAGRDYAPDRAIAIDEPFRVGSSSLMYPRDPRGEPGEIINCNCVMVTVTRVGDRAPHARPAAPDARGADATGAVHD